MMETSIRQLINTAIPGLSESVPSKTLVMPSFMLDYGYMESGNDYGNGKCEDTNHYVQIDLYYTNKTAFQTAKQALKQALIANKMFDTLESYFDTTNKYYRATFQFVVVESEEE